MPCFTTRSVWNLTECSTAAWNSFYRPWLHQALDVLWKNSVWCFLLILLLKSRLGVKVLGWVIGSAWEIVNWCAVVGACRYGIPNYLAFTLHLWQRCLNRCSIKWTTETGVQKSPHPSTNQSLSNSFTNWEDWGSFADFTNFCLLLKHLVTFGYKRWILPFFVAFCLAAF